MISKELKAKIKALAKKYKDVDGDISLKNGIRLKSRRSNVCEFYIYKNWVYLLDDDGNDIDSNDVEEDFLESFLDYVSDENNLSFEEE